MKITPIEWSDVKNINTEKQCIIGTVPIGKYIISWNSCEENPTYKIEKSPFAGDLFSSQLSLKDAKQVCAETYESAITDCIEA